MRISFLLAVVLSVSFFVRASADDGAQFRGAGGGVAADSPLPTNGGQ